MANIKTKVLSDYEYEKLLTVFQSGLSYQLTEQEWVAEQEHLIKSGKRTKYSRKGINREIRENPVILMLLITEASLGIRICDILSLHLSDFTQRIDGRWQLSDQFIEQKTKKERAFPISNDLYNALLLYTSNHGLLRNDLLFNISERNVEKALTKACNALKHVDSGSDWNRISTHSFRKYAGMNVYERSGHDIEIVREFYQHSSVMVTQRYLGVQRDAFEKAIVQFNDGSGWRSQQ